MHSESLLEIDEKMREWCQGDVVLEADFPFLHLADLSMPLTIGARELAGEETEEEPGDPQMFASVGTTAPGFVILTQTCDIVRSARDRPFVEVAPLKQVEPKNIARARQIPSIAVVPSLSDRCLVADLDRVMTVEKSVLTSLPRTKGCTTDHERRDFAEALARKRQRFAFPDDFNKDIKKFRDRIVSKHGKVTKDKRGRETIEGQLYSQIREIRVLCSDWSADPLEVTFLFVFQTRSEIPKTAGDIIESELMGRISKEGRCADPMMRVVGLDDLPAADWLESQKLDYDYLSGEDVE